MPVKYYCPKCDRRFVDWGAEKLGFVCPTCDGEQLIQVGAQESGPAKPSLKRKSSKKAPKETVPEDLAPDPDPVADDTDTEATGDSTTVPLPQGSDDGSDDDDDVLAADGGLSAVDGISGFESVDDND